jgi:predicted DNA-binding protein with PD1-like motif
MTPPTQSRTWPFDAGRVRLARLNRGDDLLTAVEALCREDALDTALFSATGSIVDITVGVYDGSQQVYVTERIEKPLELVICAGNFVSDGRAYRIQAHAAAADLDGRLYAGRLFSPTRVVAAEVVLQQLRGDRLKRTYDHPTGLWQWTPTR